MTSVYAPHKQQDEEMKMPAQPDRRFLNGSLGVCHHEVWGHQTLPGGHVVPMTLPEAIKKGHEIIYELVDVTPPKRKGKAT